MKRLRFDIVVIGVLWLMFSCTGDGYTPELRCIDTLIDSHADSALALLDAMKPDVPNWPKSCRMRHALLTAKAQNKAFVDFTTDSVMKVVTEYYGSHGTANDQLLAHYLLGCTYRDLRETPHAIDCLLDATAKADTTATDCDFKTLGSVYSQIADMYRRLLLLSDEIKAREHSCHFALLAGDTLNSIYEKEMVAGVYILENKDDKAEILLEDVIGQYNKMGYRHDGLLASISLMHLYVEKQNRYKETKTLIDKFEAESSLFDKNHELPSSRRQYYYYKGKYYEGINHLDSAEFFYRMVYRPDMNAVSKDPMYRGLLSVFTKRHQSDSIAKYARLYCEANDSSIAIRDRNIMELTLASYNYNRYQRQAVESENKFYHSLLLLLGLAVCLIICILAIIFGVKYYKQKRKELIKQHQEKEAIIMAALDKATEEYNHKMEELQILEETHRFANIDAVKTISTLRAEKENYQAEYAKAQQKIAETNVSYEKEKVRLTAEITSLSEKIESYKREHGIAIALKKADNLEEESIIMKLRQMARKPKNTITEKDFILLEKTICNYYPTLIYDLKQNTKFNNTDRLICILTVLKFRPGDIVNLTGLTNSTVTNTREKLNKQLFNINSASSLLQNLANQYSF